MRVRLAIRLSIAHLAGQGGLALFGVIWNGNPSLNEFFFYLAMALLGSVALFWPVLLLALIFARPILDHPWPFVIAGPFVVAAATYLLLGWQWLYIIGASSVIGSVAFAALTVLSDQVGRVSKPKSPSTAS
ncbi:MAG: hypothetical protein AAGG79_07760 [Pseudomonadota bacterium]